MYKLLGKLCFLVFLWGSVFLIFNEEETSVRVKTMQNEKEESKHYVEVISRDQSERIELETYLIGVVASEMPYCFEEEALKAQSVAARTFVMQRGLKVDNTTNTQVYKSQTELKEIYEDTYEKMYEKIKKAVEETKGEVLLYDGEYISALFYSCNNGKSNDSSWYFKGEKPYLKSVDSKWDLQYENCHTSIEKSEEEIKKKLNIDTFNVSNIEYYENGYVKSINIGGKQFSGREVREKLGLRSSCFSFVEQGNAILIQCSVYGHGVGMSQYGANGMAKEGYNYKEILMHYYSGVEIGRI